MHFFAVVVNDITTTLSLPPSLSYCCDDLIERCSIGFRRLIDDDQAGDIHTALVCAGGSLLADALSPPLLSEMGPPLVTIDVWVMAG